MSKKSALTAALSGGGTTGPPDNKPPVPVPSTKPKLISDFSAFPCLASAPGSTDSDEITENLQSLGLQPYQPHGSAPTVTLLQGASSFENARLYSGKNRNFLSEAVIGSLPQGLTEEEKMRIAENTPLSPSLNVLKDLPVDKVSSRTAEGRKLRRHVLKGAVIVFVTAGYSGKRFIFEKARELGIKSVVLDGPDSWVQMLQKEGIIEAFLPIDFSDAETVFPRCLEAIRKATSKLGGLDGITTFCEVAVPLVSRLAEKLGVTANTPAAVDAARDKFATRAAMEKAGLPTPRNSLITSADDLDAAAAHVRFPAVIKPISGAASIGVIRVDDLPQLRTAYARVQRDLKRAKIVAGALVEGADGDDEDEHTGGVPPKGGKFSASKLINLQAMLEEYLDGEEVDCDLILSNGAAVYGAITDNWPTVEPYFNETGSNCPSILDRSRQRELLELSVASVKALGLSMGVFHVECKYTSRGPRLIEVNCRMGGGPVRDTNLLVWGVDLVEEHLLCSAGIPARPPVARRPLMQIAEYSINAVRSGTIQHTDFLKQWEGHPDVLYAKPLVQPGDRVVCVADGLPTWVCEIMVTKPTVQEAIQFIKDIERQLEIPIV